MTHIPHSVAAEFPDAHQILHRLKSSNAHFNRLADEHHDVNHEIHRIEVGQEPASDERTEMLKKRRLALLDEIAAMISAEEERTGE